MAWCNPLAVSEGCRRRLIWRASVMTVLRYVLTLVLIASAAAVAAGLADDRVLRRQDARKWQRVAEVSRLKARSGAREFLETSSSVSFGIH